jgi:hypothetical protein
MNKLFQAFWQINEPGKSCISSPDSQVVEKRRAFKEPILTPDSHIQTESMILTQPARLYRFQLPRIIRGSHRNWHQKPATNCPQVYWNMEFPWSNSHSLAGAYPEGLQNSPLQLNNRSQHKKTYYVAQQMQSDNGRGWPCQLISHTAHAWIANRSYLSFPACIMIVCS